MPCPFLLGSYRESYLMPVISMPCSLVDHVFMSYRECKNGHVFTIYALIADQIRLFLLSLAKPQKYVQVFLSHGVGMGLGVGLTFVATVSLSSHHFRRRRSLATGIIMSGNSLGAAIFPISESCHFTFSNRRSVAYEIVIVIKFVQS